MNKYKIYMYVGIAILILSITGSLAYYNYVGTYRSVSTITRGLDYYINYTKGNDITSSTLNPSISYTDGNNLTITLYKKDNTYNIYGHIYLDVSSVSTNLSNSNALKYVVMSDDNTISSGTLGDISSNNSYLLAVNIPLEIIESTYTIYLWYDSTEKKAELGENLSISATVRCEATMKEINDYNYDFSAPLADKITKLYNKATKTTVMNNNVTYQYDTVNNLMKDIDGNIRYYGASPNNYVYFNCNDYNNQTSSTCEVWRIIGVFNDKVKIIRNSSIGMYSFDNRGTSSGAETIYGSNNWTISRLMMLLNSGYDSETGGSLYWNRLSGNCYSGSSAVDNIKTCDLSNVGLKNDTTRNLIKEHTYSLLGYESPSLYANEAYEMEQETGSVSTGRPTSWTGKIALMYPSDYGYGADFSVDACSSSRISNYYGCRNNNWLYNGKEWLLTPKSGGYTAKNNAIDTNANVTVSLSAYGEYDIRPVLYISSSLEIESGTGSSTNPYQLKVN